jgi:hypothetical protein
MMFFRDSSQSSFGTSKSKEAKDLTE